ncbi:long-chain fatty acid--CoA ligase [Salinirubellus salinus]|uniref:Long-chain fatty acid--CoA ligase n=1 Tax=Salinirubellus salinus TaxID=1364945 RepID=A0A9E7U9G1_9EURY|nr:long-chain fatty acid--CoA ligase [Salinirubellus salinus]UWM53208.1 long-chain fatty acid--CoA ligase [Salinirubellus salinus]
MTNLVAEVAAAVDEYPTETAIAYDGTVTSYEEFWDRAGRFAAALDERGLGPDDRVAIYLPNLPQFVTAFYGTLRAGGIVVPMNPQYKAREITHLLSDSGTKAVVTLAENAGAVESVVPETDVEHVVSVGEDVESATEFEAFLADETLDVVDRADDDVACQPYTSGTTGKPKGVLLSHHNLAWTGRTNAELVEGGLTTDDGLVGTLPLFHIYGMSVVMNAALVNGAAYYPVTEWDATEVMTSIEEHRLTVMYGVPAMFNDMINQPDATDYDLSSLRFINSGGDSLPIEVLETFEELFDAELYEGYGLTETSPTTHANKPGARRKGSIGKPLPGVDSKVVGPNFEPMPRVEEGPVDEDVDLDAVVGEIVVAGPNVMQGYYGLPEANAAAFTDEDGTRWFHTGDLGYWDEDDFFYVVDRDKHMIVTGGYNVYPREIEELLYEHPDVAEAAVVGIPDERRNETVKAFVVPVPDADLSGETIKEYCLDRLAAYKHPREVAIVDELPRTTTGKVQKYELENE